MVATAYAAPAFASSAFVDPVSSCWQNAFGSFDLRYNGPVNRIANASFRGSTDGTCSDNSLTFPTVVRAPSFAAANAACMSLLFMPTSGSLNQIGYPGAPPDFYLWQLAPLGRRP